MIFAVTYTMKTLLELKLLSKHWFRCVVAQRCNNCIAGDHTLPSSQWILGGNGTTA